MRDSDKFVLVIFGMCILFILLPGCFGSTPSKALAEGIHPSNIDPIVPHNIPTTIIEVEPPPDANILLEAERESADYEQRFLDTPPPEGEPELPNTSGSPYPWEWSA